MLWLVKTIMVRKNRPDPSGRYARIESRYFFFQISTKGGTCS